MTRFYFEKKSFKNFHRAYTEKKRLEKVNLHCKVIENADETYKLKITSVKEASQNLLLKEGFKVVKVESL